MLEQHLRETLDSWKLIKDIGLERFGMVYVKNIIKFCPECLDMFPFKDIPNMYQSAIYKTFCSKVMYKIEEELIENIADLEHHKANTFPRLINENRNMGVSPSM